MSAFLRSFRLPPHLRLLHKGDLLRPFRNSGSVTYVSTLLSPSSSFETVAQRRSIASLSEFGLSHVREYAPLPSSSVPYISSFVQSLRTFLANARRIALRATFSISLYLILRASFSISLYLILRAKSQHIFSKHARMALRATFSSCR